jgi:hypothetical protein
MTNNNSPKTSNQILKKQNKEFHKLFKDSIVNIKNDEYKNEKKAYQNSFDDLKKFESTITAIKKKAINCIIFNSSNADGIMSAYIAIKFLTENNKTDITPIPAKASSGHGINSRLFKYKESLKDKVILIVDLCYNKENLDFYKSLGKEVYVIDDHPTKNNKNIKNNKHFIGNNSHAAIAYTWKFFYPKEEVPLFVQMIDNDDRKLQLPFLSQYRNLTTFYNYRLYHNPYLKVKFDKVEDFKHLDVIIKNDMGNIMNIIGHYYDELANNIKTQVAINAQLNTFQGHPVYVLNYNDPVLTNVVLRQMVTNAHNRGHKIDFAVCWGYEYTSNSYRVVLSEHHTSGKPQHNLPEMARKLGKIGGHQKGGGGAMFMGNFYWPRNKGRDIWDLFTKTPTFLE